jgi:hypothetical protein
LKALGNGMAHVVKHLLACMKPCDQQPVLPRKRRKKLENLCIICETEKWHFTYGKQDEFLKELKVN